MSSNTEFAYRGWVTIDEQFIDDVVNIINATEVEIADVDDEAFLNFEASKPLQFKGVSVSSTAESFALLHGVNRRTTCYTDGLSYGNIIGAILLRAASINKGFKVGSDGDWKNDWQDARILYAKVFLEDAERPEEVIKRI